MPVVEGAALAPRLGDAVRVLGVDPLVDAAGRRFALLGSNPAALDGPLKSRWLGIVASNATAAEWDKLRAMAKASKSAVERGAFYTLLGNAKDPALASPVLRPMALEARDRFGAYYEELDKA